MRFAILKNRTSAISRLKVNYKMQMNMKFVVQRSFKFLRLMQKLDYKLEIVNSNRCSMISIKPKSKTQDS